MVLSAGHLESVSSVRRFSLVLAELPHRIRETLFEKATVLGLAAGGLLGLGITWGLGGIYSSEVGRPSAAIASSFLLNLSLLAALLMSLPGRIDDPDSERGRRPDWPLLSAWIRFALWCGIVFLGFAWASGATVSWGIALALAALTMAQGSMLTGIAGMLGHLAGRFQRYARVVLVLGCALLSISLFWTKPLLSELKSRDYRAQVASENGTAVFWAPAATQAVFVLSPPTAVASVWNGSESNYDLIRGPNTYRIWVGSWIIPYPRIWPRWVGREGSADAPQGPWNQGLVLSFFIWGLVVTLGSDVVEGLKSFAPSSQRQSPKKDSATATASQKQGRTP